VTPITRVAGETCSCKSRFRIGDANVLCADTLQKYSEGVRGSRSDRDLPPGSPLLWRRKLGQALSEHRRRAGLTGEEAAAHVERSGSWISRVETGRVGLRTRDLGDLLDLYGISDSRERHRLEDAARKGNQRGWWSRYAEVLPDSYSTFIALEAGAESIRSYENVVIPGLLQTSDYARAVFKQSVPLVDEHSIDKLIEVRMKRQAFRARYGRPKLTAFIEESILYRAIGGVQVLIPQVKRLIEATKTVDLRILPLTRSEPIVLTTSFSLISLEGEPDIAYVETATGGVFEDEQNAHRYMQIFNELEKMALGSRATVAALHEALERLR
jgi:hypothetical protein